MYIEINEHVPHDDTLNGKNLSCGDHQAYQKNGKDNCPLRWRHTVPAAFHIKIAVAIDKRKQPEQSINQYNI